MNRCCFLPLALSIGLTACTPTTARVGPYDVRWTASPAEVVVERDGKELLRTAGAPIASRKSDPTWKFSFGSFKVTDDDAPWTERTALEADVDDGTVTLDFGDGHPVTLASPDGERLDLTASVPSSANRVRTNFVCGAGDHFLGFGSQADAVDHRGHRIPIWTSEPGIGKTDDDEVAPNDESWILRGTRHAASYGLPTFLTNRGSGGAMGVVADTTRRIIFDLCKADPNVLSVETWDTNITFRLYPGTPAKALENLTAEIGRQPLANDLALAPWNDAIFGSDTVREVANLLRRERIPSGALWTEDFRGGHEDGENYRLEEEWDVDRRVYPDVEALANELHSKGFRWFAYHNTFLVKETRVFEEAKAAGVVLKHEDGSDYLFTGVKFTPTGLVDLTHPEGPKFVIDRLNRILSYGFDGWMADYAEWLPHDALLANGADPIAYHNVYPRAYHETVAQSLATHPAPQYATSFSRSGTLRTAPYQPVVWAGDQWTNMLPDDGLPTVVTMGLNFGLAGLAIYGHDIAGYQNGTYGPSTKETFFRWTTLGALSPVMRTHHGTKARANWWFGKDEETLAHFRRWSRLHARLWPYLRAEANRAHATGMPIMRSLAIDYPQFDAAWTLKDEYLFGPSMLVAPVVTEGATTRTLWLPPGEWMPFEGGPGRSGNAEITVDAPITELPVFVPTGTILPMLPDTIDTLMPADAPLVDLDDVRNVRTLHLYGGKSGALTDLDGTTYAFEWKSGPSGTIDAAGGTVDEARRTLTLRGENLTAASFAAGGSTFATLTVSGATKVTEVVLHY